MDWVDTTVHVAAVSDTSVHVAAVSATSVHIPLSDGEADALTLGDALALGDADIEGLADIDDDGEADILEDGLAEIEVEGDTIRALLTKLSEQYKQADVDFDPFNPRTNDLDADYDVLVNDKNYINIPGGLTAKLRDGDEVKVKIVWRWDG